MEIDKIIGVVVFSLVLIALVVLLFFAVLSTLKIETEERKTRSKMYKTITKYLEYLLHDD